MPPNILQLLSYAGILALFGLSLAFSASLPESLSPSKQTPLRSAPGYVGSERCQACHAVAYDTWHKSFHRSMTRTVNELAFDGLESPALPADFQFYGRDLSLWRSTSGRTMYRGPDLQLYGQRLAQLKYQSLQVKGVPSQENGRARMRALKILETIPTVERELVLATGSHHYIAFFVAGTEEQELRQFPFVYYLADKVWLKREAAFIQPPSAPPHITRWNANCIQCHSVAGAPYQTDRHDLQGHVVSQYRSAVAELGIACEACHGPGEQHSNLYENPFERLQLELSHNTAKSVSNPGALNAQRSSQICGQCHSYFLPINEEHFWSKGHRDGFLPGQALGQTRELLSFPGPENQQKRIEADERQIFFANGAMRVAGREYNDLLASPCFSRASNDKQKMGCLSCHNSHDSEPNDQLNPDLSEQQLCTQCHASEQLSLKEQSLHQLHGVSEKVQNARCIDCHMPKTSYALLSAIRSHRVVEKLSLPVTQARATSVSVAPPSCVMCHIVEGRSFFTRQESSGEPPYSFEFILRGDAGVRAVMADAFARSEETHFASVVLEFLAQNETYAAVQWIAQRGVRQLNKKIASPNSSQSMSKREKAALLAVMSAAWLKRDQRPISISE